MNTEKPKPQRRTNAERSAETRQRVIDATILSLGELGYQNTSINLVADRAGVSKGATQHQFPTKVDLMAATARYCVQVHNEFRLQLVAKITEGDDKIAQWADTSWDVLRHPAFKALLDIFIATRSDPELKERMRPISQAIQDEFKIGVEPFCRAAGIDPDPLVLKMIRAHVIFTRGIATGLMFTHDPEILRQDMETLKLYEQLAIEMLKKKQGKV